MTSDRYFRPITLWVITFAIMVSCGTKTDVTDDPYYLEYNIEDTSGRVFVNFPGATANFRRYSVDVSGENEAMLYESVVAIQKVGSDYFTMGTNVTGKFEKTTKDSQSGGGVLFPIKNVVQIYSLTLHYAGSGTDVTYRHGY